MRKCQNRPIYGKRGLSKFAHLHLRPHPPTQPLYFVTIQHQHKHESTRASERVHTHSQTDLQTDRQTDRPTDRQTDAQRTDTQTLTAFAEGLNACAKQHIRIAEVCVSVKRGLLMRQKRPITYTKETY